MKISTMKSMAGLGQGKNVGIVVAALLTAMAVAGWAIVTMFVTDAAAIEELPASAIARKNEMKRLPHEELKPSLIGSYEVTGTDSDGKPYVGPTILDVALAPSGALELEWDNGKQVGVGQVIGNVLAVACSTKGRTVILIMSINRDGSLSGNWLRRTDRCYKGSEMWKKK